jgi:hypothetical protein
MLLVHCGGDSSSRDTKSEEQPATGGRPPRNTATVVEGADLPCAVADTLRNYCWSCHGVQPRSGAPFALVTRDELLLQTDQGQTRAVRAATRMRDDKAPMPRMGARVPESEIAGLEAWIASGSPAETCSGGSPGSVDCKTCDALVADTVACAPRGNAPNLCKPQEGASFYLCSGQQCSDECGLALPGQTPSMPCDPANATTCRECIETKCAVELEACK